jgi:hypothetical protein
MKIVQIIPKVAARKSLKSLLKDTERRLRKERGDKVAFHRSKEGCWKHFTYPGEIRWDEAAGGMIVAEIVGSKDSQLLQAFVGYLDRHLGDSIGSISIWNI